MGQILSFGLKFGMSRPPGLKLLMVFKENTRVYIYLIMLLISLYQAFHLQTKKERKRSNKKCHVIMDLQSSNQ